MEDQNGIRWPEPEPERRERPIRVDANVNIYLHPASKPPAASQILIYGGNMGLSIVAGGAALLVQLIPLPSGSVFDSPADLALTCDDANVIVAPASGDTTGTMFDVSAPASAPANPSANLNATGLAGGVKISGTAPLAVQAATAPPATSIGIVAAGPGPPPAAAPGAGAAPAATQAKGRAPAK